ncbi:MAG: DUF4412 domain-containing protein [Chthoniobacterales bacterium]
MLSSRILAVLLLTSTLLRADLVIVQDVDAMGQQVSMTLKTKGTMMRVDLNPKMSILIDGATGDMKTLMHDQKMFMSMNMDAMKGMMPAPKPGATAKPTLKALGNKQKISGYDTEEYLYTQGDTVSHLWIAKDYPHYDAFVKVMETLRKGPIGQMSPQMQMDMTQLPGMPLKTIVDMGGKSGTSVVKSVEEKDLDPSDFVAPADYKSFAMPTIPPPNQ